MHSIYYEDEERHSPVELKVTLKLFLLPSINKVTKDITIAPKSIVLFCCWLRLKLTGGGIYGYSLLKYIFIEAEWMEPYSQDVQTEH